MIRKILVCCLFITCLAFTMVAYGKETIADFFYPEGVSTYEIYREGVEGPVSKATVHFEKTSVGGRLTVETAGFRNTSDGPTFPLETLQYNLLIDENSVIAKTWWTKYKSGGLNSKGNVRQNLVMLKLPDDGSSVSWETGPDFAGTMVQKWKMTALRKDDILKVICLVYDMRGMLLSEMCSTEYWQKGKGKIKETFGKINKQ